MLEDGVKGEFIGQTEIKFIRKKRLARAEFIITPSQVLDGAAGIGKGYSQKRV